MATLYRNAAGVDFDDLFEADSNGVTVPGYYQADGVTLLKYAPASSGSRIPDVMYYSPPNAAPDFGADVSTIWAGKGTVSYTVPSVPDMGVFGDENGAGRANYMAMISAMRDDTGARCDMRTDLTILPNGKYQLMYRGWRVQGNDKSMVSSGGRTGNNYPEGVIFLEGNWAQSPKPGFGNNYTVDFVEETHQWGRYVHYTDNDGSLVNVALNDGSGVISPRDGTRSGLGTNLPLSSMRSVGDYLYSVVGQNYAPKDDNGLHNRFSRGKIRVTIKRNGVPVLSWLFKYNNVNSYSPITNNGNQAYRVPGVSKTAYVSGTVDAQNAVSGQTGFGCPSFTSIGTETTVTPTKERTDVDVAMYRVVTANGCQLDCGDRANFRCSDGTNTLVSSLAGKSVLTKLNGTIAWSAVSSVTPLAKGDLRGFDMGANDSYFAGTASNALIAVGNSASGGNWITGSVSSGGGGGGGGGCVVLDAEMFDGRTADDFRVGDAILVTDPYAPEDGNNSAYGTIGYSEPTLQPCVEIETASGAILRMSTTAPIPTQYNGLLLAPELIGEFIAIATRDEIQSVPADDTANVTFQWDQVIAVRDIGEQWVRHISVDHIQHCFWATSGGQWFVLHHNKINGCVAVESIMYDERRAGDYVVGDDLLITDPYSTDNNSVTGKIRHARPSLQPMVRIRTASGASLRCSHSAPIPTQNGGYQKAPSLLGQFIPVAEKSQLNGSNTPFVWDEVVEVVDIGMGWVQHIFVEERCFWASEDGELFILHHNLKDDGTGDTGIP